MMPEPSLPADLYRGTAAYYDRYRPAYPAALLDDLCQRVPVTGAGRLLDLACGTGQVAIPLASRFAAVVAVDQEGEAVALGRAKARTAGYHTIRWVRGAAESVRVGAGFHLVTVGTAFHRLDGPVVARRMHTWLRPGGAAALLWSPAPSQGDAPWQEALTALVAAWISRIGTGRFLPPTPDPDGKAAAPADLHRATLVAAGFRYEGSFEFQRRERWTAEALAGFMFSTSILSRAALGLRSAAFEHDLRRLVDTHAPGGALESRATYRYQLARKPGGGAGRGTPPDSVRSRPSGRLWR